MCQRGGKAFGSAKGPQEESRWLCKSLEREMLAALPLAAGRQRRAGLVPAGEGPGAACWLQVPPWRSLWEPRPPLQRPAGGMLPKSQVCAVCCRSSLLAPSRIAAKYQPGSAEALQEWGLLVVRERSRTLSQPSADMLWPGMVTLATSMPHISRPLEVVSKELLLK